MNPLSVKKDSDSVIPANQFEAFNSTLNGNNNTVEKGKKVETVPGSKEPVAKSPFETFNENLKKKDLPGVPSSGSGSEPNVSQEGSTSSSNGGEVVLGLQKKLSDAKSFIDADIATQPNSDNVSLYPAVTGPDGKPLPEKYQRATNAESGKAPLSVRVKTNPQELSAYVNTRAEVIDRNLKELKIQQSKFVDYSQKQITPKVTKTVTNITNPGEYYKLEGEIQKQEKYLRDLKVSAAEVVGQNLVEQYMTKPNAKHSIGIPRELGREIIRNADKQTNDQYTALEETNTPLGAVPNADMELIGLEAWKKYILLHPEMENRDARIQDLQKWESEFDERNMELTAARVRHKIGATLQKKAGFLSSIYRSNPTQMDLIEAAKNSNLTPSEQKIFESYVLPVEKRIVGTEIPMSGFFNKFGEAVEQNVMGLQNIFRSDTERLSEALNQEVDTKYDEVGEFSRDKQELARLEQKAKSKEGVTADDKKRIAELKNYNDVRNWYDKFWDGAGDLTGQVAYQATLARLFGGVGNTIAKAPVVGGLIAKGTTMVGGSDAVNLALTSFLTSYDNHAKEAVVLMPRKDQAMQRRLYSYTMSAMEGLSEGIFKDTKVLDAFKKQVAPDIVKLTARLSAREITEEAAKSRLKDILTNKLKPFAKDFVKAEVQEGVEEAVVDVAAGISESVFAGRDFDAEKTFGNAANTFLTTMAYSPFVSGAAAARDVRSSAYGKSGIYKMATDPETYRREVYRLQQEGLPQQEADEKLQIINTAAEIQKQLPVKKSINPKSSPQIKEFNSKWKENISAIENRTDIDDAEKEKLKSAEDARNAQEVADYMKTQGRANDSAMDYPESATYLTHRLNEALLDKKIGQTSDENVIADLEAQKARSKKIREGIYKGEIIIGNNLEEIAVDEKLAEELGITSLADADEDSLPNNISKPKIEKDENAGNSSEKQQAGSESESSSNIGEQKKLDEQALQQNKGKPVDASEEAGNSTGLPSGFTQEQFDKLGKRTQEKLLAKEKDKAKKSGKVKTYELIDGGKMDAEPIEIEGYEDLDLAVGQEPGTMNWKVISVLTGGVISDGFSREEAIDKASKDERSKGITNDLLEKKIYQGKYGKGINIKNQSDKYDKYLAGKQAEEDALPPLYSDEEKARINAVIEKTDNKDQKEFLTGQLDRKKGMKISIDFLERKMNGEFDNDAVDYSETNDDNIPKTLSPDEKKKRAISKARNIFDKKKKQIENSSEIFKDERIAELETGLNDRIELLEKRYDSQKQPVNDLEEEYNSKTVDELVAIKKKKYPNPDIESAMSADEKLLDRIIASKFSELNQKVIEKRNANRFNDNEKAAIEAIKTKDLSKTSVAPYVAIINDETKTPAERKAALKDLSDQLNDDETAEATGEALGGKISDAIYDLGYPKVENNNFRDRLNTTEAKQEFEEVDGKIVPKKKTVQQNAVPADVSYQPLENISTDVKRFQPRGTDFSQASVDKIVNDYDENKLDPVVIFKDKDGQDFVLAGHSRLKAHETLTELPDNAPRKENAIENGFRPGEIKARYFTGTEKEAIEFADRSNDLGTKNKDYESAASLRKAREAGETKKAIQDRAKSDFGKNWRYINNLSYLNPNGKAIQTLQQFENNPDKDGQNKIEKAAQWIGAVNERMGGLLTNQHENEMFDYLMDKSRSTKLERENDFINLIQNITGRFDFNPNEPLNLNRIKNKTAAEVNYDTEEAEIKNSIKEKQQELDNLNDRLNNPQSAAYVNPSSSDYSQVLKVAEGKKTAINQELTALRKELVEHQQDKGKVISSGLAQPGLFDMANLTPAEVVELNEELKPDGITVENINSYEESISDTGEISQPGVNDNQETTEVSEAVQQPTNDQGRGTEQNQSRAAVSGQQRASTAIATTKGVLPNNNGVYPHEQVEEYVLPNPKKGWRGVPNASVHYAQLENGKWIATHEWYANNGGHSSGLTATTQYDTKFEAVNEELKKIEQSLASSLNTLPAYRKWIDATRQAIQNEPGANVAATPQVDPVEQEKKEKLQKAKDDFRASLRKSRGKLSANPIDLEVLANGVKLIAAYADMGIYKFKQIVQDIAETIGSDFLDNENINALKGVYAYHRSNLPKEERAAYDNEDAVDTFLEEDLQLYTSPRPTTEKEWLQKSIEESERENDDETAQYYRDELALLESNPYEYWKVLYEAYSPSDTEERKEEAYENMIKEQNKLQDGTNTASNLESDSTRRDTTDGLGQGSLFPASEQLITETESGGTEIIGQLQPASSPSLFPFDAVVVGEGSNNAVPVNEQLEGLDTRPAGVGNSSGSSTADEDRIPFDTGAGESIERLADSLTGQTIAEKIEAQKAAESIPVKDMDLDNIRATLPFLMKEQQEDVYKAEQRFIGEKDNADKLYGKGMMFTNGTGTGKTLTGLGIAKRFEKRGKGNGLIVVPSDVKAKDWMAEGKDYMQMDIHQLEGITDGGKENQANITTYANFRENAFIKNRTWDYVIYDESHKINSNGAGTQTSGEAAHNQATTSPRVARQKAKAAINYESRVAAISERNSIARENNEAVDYEATKLLEAELTEQTIREFKKTNVVFLSATPFAYHPNLTYADGYLFKINEEFDPQYGSNSYNNFYISNFGYRIRYNKLTKPESGVDVDLLERQFTENLKKQGVVVSRKLNVDKDYSRQFIIVDDKLGEKIDEGMDIANNREEFKYLNEAVSKRMNFLYKNQLMEAIKAKWAVDRIKQHMALGRKVVVFHNYIDNAPAHPFDFTGLVPFNNDNYTRINTEIQQFNEKYPEYRNLDLRGISNPIATLKKAFGNKVVFFNGTESKKDRNAAKKRFNDDSADGADIIVIQTDAGKEGISLHDRTGKNARALINLGLPYKPTDAIQTEGRIYRTGQKTDAVLEYPILNLNFERFAYATKINERVRTAENFALGEEARNMETAFKEGYINATNEDASLEQGKGGKEEDARQDGISEFQKALTYYYKRGKRTAADKRNVSGDYYASPEPLGMKMVEWADPAPNEKGLEPSAGHAAIARFFPRTTKNMFIEPNTALRSETAINTFGTTQAGTFEDLHIINKFDFIVQNPPFGVGGKLAMEHVIKGLGHLNDMGRSVNLVPTGSSMEKRLIAWEDSDASKNFYITAKILLPSSVFERAGTKVMTQILVIDKVENAEDVKRLPQQRNIDLTQYDNIKDFFDAIENLSIPPRIEAGKYAVADEAGENDTPAAQENAAASTTQVDNGEDAPPVTSNVAEVVKNFHEKRQRDNWVVKLNKKVGEADFAAMKSQAKDLGGMYSFFKGNGAIPGFQFDNPAAANKMLAAIEGQGVPEAEKMSLADRIRAWKISKTGQQLYTTIVPGGPQIWNAAVEVVAKAVQAGTALITAMQKGREYIQQNWSKSWNKAKYNEEMLLELKGRGVMSYNLTPAQIQQADQAIQRIQRNGKLIKEINSLREAYDLAISGLTDPQDIIDAEEDYTEFERYLFDGLSAQEIEKMETFHLGLEDQTYWQKVKENWQNKFQRLEQIQKEIEASGLTIDEKNDMVNRADRWKSIAAAKIDNILRKVGLADVDVFVWKGRQKLENSMFDRMAKDKVDYRKFNLYMYAQHAPERNAHNAKVRRENFAKKVAQIENDIQKYKDDYIIVPAPATKALITKAENQLEAYEAYEAAYNDPTTNKNYLKLLEKKIDRKFLLMDDGGSGMTNEQAAEIIEEANKEGSLPMFEKYEDVFRKEVIDESLRLQKEYGLIDDNNYEYLKNYYSNYVPLNVDDKYLAEKGGSFTSSDIPGATIYKSKGSENYDFEKRTNPVTQSIINLQAVILEGEENKYKQTVAETIKTAPDKDIWELRSALYAPVKDKTGKVVGLDEINIPPNGIPYQDDGQKKYLVINDKALFEAMKGVNVKHAIPLLAKINGFFRSLHTLYNPAFTVSNLFRDAQTAGVVMSTNQKEGVAKNYRANVKKIFAIIKGSYDQQGGKNATYWQQKAQEYKDAGGQMTWFNNETTADQIEDVENAFKKYEKTGTFEAGKNLGLGIANFINRANTAVENSTRLAIYDAMQKAGVPDYKAVEMARNATINFQKKGNYGAMADSLYLFFNAAIQGTTNVFKTLLTTKAGLKMAGGIIMAGMVMNIYNNLMDDCDENANPANCYKNIPDYEKERNIIIKIPFGGKGFIKIPLAYGFNVFYNIGTEISDGVVFKNRSLAASSAFILKSAFNSFNPTGGVDQPLLQHISPTVTDPVVQFLTNKDAFGRPIYNDDKYNKKPDSQSGFNSDSRGAHELAEWLNKQSGGNEKVKGKMDVSPGTLDFIFETATGGMGQFMKQFIGSTRDAIDTDKNVNMKDVPIVNRFYTAPRKLTDKSNIYNSLDDSYNTIMSPDQITRFNAELKAAVEAGEMDKDKATKYERTVAKNQYQLNNQELFSIMDKSKTQKLEPYERENFEKELIIRSNNGEFPQSWIKTYKAQLTKNQNALD